MPTNTHNAPEDAVGVRVLVCIDILVLLAFLHKISPEVPPRVTLLPAGSFEFEFTLKRVLRNDY
jgi:hypothetical protein